MTWKFSGSIHNRWALVTLLCGLCITIFVTIQVNTNNQLRINKAVQLASDQTIKTVKERISLYQYGLRGARGAILTAGEDNLSRRIFMRYSLSRNIDDEFPGARGFGFIRLVKQTDIKKFVNDARQDGWLHFSIKELAPHSGDRYVIQYIEPLARNLQAIGLDIASEKNRRIAAKNALETGKVQLTGPITLVQASGSPLQSFLILMPIYDSGAVPDTLEKRKARAYGWSYAPLLMQDVMVNLGLDNTRVHVDLYDVTDPSDRERFFDSHANFSSHTHGHTHGLYVHTKSFAIYGRIWESHFSIYPAFIQDLGLPSSRNVFIIGVLISFLSATLLGVIRVSRRHHQEVIAQQAKMAAIVEGSSDGIIGTTLDGIITSWNKGAEKIFGYRRRDVLGDSFYRLLVPDELYDHEKQLFERIKRGEELGHFDTIRKNKAGEEIPVSVSISPIYSANGSVIGTSKSVRDISLQKAAEAKIHELNSTLENQVKERTEALQTLNLVLNDVLNASSEIAIIATDIHGTITLFNSGAQRMLKYSDKEVIGLLTQLAFHLPEEVDEVRKVLSAQSGIAIKPGLSTLFYPALHNESDSREWTYIDKQGHYLDVSVVMTPMHDNSGEIIGFLNMAIDITEQKKSNAEIISVRDQLLMAANVAQLGIWIWHVQTDELDWNDMMFQIYQKPITLREKGLMYQHWVECLHPDDKVAFDVALQEALNNGGEFDQMFRIVLPNNNVRYIQARAYVEQDRQGRAVSLTGINRDITQEHELETWLRRAKEHAEAASVAKSEFLANMSHEIRTPMNAVLGMLALVQRTSLNIKQEDYIVKAHTAATSLLGLINDILDYSKVDVGKLEIEHAPFEIAQVISELDVLLSGLVKGDKVTLHYDVDPDIPALLIGDHLRLLQVLTNLSSNALKFTMEGQVDIAITQISRSAHAVYLQFSVKDTGIGIDISQREHIFEVFSQAESSTARRFGGSGLGLVISRRLVRLMGGDLIVDSELGEGSRFYFALELSIADQNEIRINAEHLAEKASQVALRKLQNLNLLVVEDNAFNRQVAEELLQAEGATVTLAEGGQEGVVAVLEAEPSAFDLVLMDMQMPNVDGLEATRRIRQDHRFSRLPIIAMTANVSKADQQACLQAGMNDHISKPLDIDVMVSTICRHVGRSQTDFLELSAQDEETMPNMNQAERVEGYASIMARFADNLDLYKSLTNSFLQESEGLISALEQGINNNDKKSVQESLHTLKGSTGTMGLSALSEQISGVETQLKQTEEVRGVLVNIDVRFYREQLKMDFEYILRDLDNHA
ncbi:CHASE domain-containing protein [Marinomonas flavescens]|uniref:CHASE domain-containing protein n=1 Tax=Marinomonas flavescens TaxID=2529379 RepID=UPI001056857A|nr:CHASE domain-containing protein [Marinomonas flavescens]